MLKEEALGELNNIRARFTALDKLINEYEGDTTQARGIQIKLNQVERRLALVALQDEEVQIAKTEVVRLVAILNQRYAVMEEAVGVVDAKVPINVAQKGVWNKKNVPVARWGITFSGDGHDLSVAAFLERVEELRIARNASKEDVWSEAVDLFSGQALVWFRSIRRSISTLKELEYELKQEFQPADYNQELWEEIRNRTQGENERPGLFLAVMDNLFARLSFSITVAEKLAICRRNLHPYFQDRICLQTIESIVKLREVCKQLEDGKSLQERFRPPPSVKNLLEPDLGYNGRKTRPTLMAMQSSQGNNVGQTFGRDWVCAAYC